jgi:hypothetical protein
MTTTRRFHPHRFASWALAAAALAVGCVLPAAAEPVPLGPETVLGSRLGWDLLCPVLAGHDDGSFAVAWDRVDETDQTELVVRTADAGGVVDPEHVVAARRPRFQIDRMRLAADGEGYTVLWKHYDDIVDGARRAFFASERDADGASLGAPIDLGRPATDVTPRPEGGFVAAWSAKKAVNVQLLDAEGDAERPPVKTSTARPFVPQVVHGDDGRFVVFWRQRGSSGDSLVARRFDAFGRPQGPTLKLVPPPAGFRFLSNYRLALGVDGTLAVAYSLEPGTGPPHVSELLLLRTFDASGQPLQPPIVVEQTGVPRQNALAPNSVTVDAAGNTLLLWTRLGNVSDPSATSHAAVLPRGALVVEPFDLASPASAGFDDVGCALGTLAGDSWVIAWAAAGRPAGSLFEFRLFVRRFRP